MEYKYLITSEIKSKLDKENIGNDVREKLYNYLNSNSQLKASSLMANLLVSKVNSHSGPRFVWFQEIRQDYCIYILRRIYKHDEYIKKLNDATKQHWMIRHALSVSEKNELELLFEDFFKGGQRLPLPEEYRKYEDKRAFDKHRDVVIYELPLWYNGMKKVSKEYWMKIQEALSENILKDYKQYDVFMYHTTNNYTITYRFGNPNSIEKSDIYLLQIVKGKEPDFEELIERKYDCDNVTDLQNYSSKCYPDYYTYDYEAWKEVEEDNMANLALSEEEITILQNAKFPFFVSGLAGSGKSTVLYYLYANIYKYIAQKHPDHNLLFMSYNNTLVDKARMSVKSILSYHSSNQEFDFRKYFENHENIQHFNNCFVSFRDFLKIAFLNEESIERFNEDKHITYEKFRELYRLEYQHGKKLSPSIVWSVIHSFIKGRGLKPFTPEDYESDVITRNDRTVTYEVYTQVYKIWKDWYRHYYENGEGWDDLDLVKYALTNGDSQNVFHNYAVIFCDEAQDFTKLEIDLILSLSKHSEYNLSFNPLDQRIPIAFAGDPNQTISPTGFRWASTKALFNKAFKDALSGYSELDDQELSINYRSQLGIVKLANSIQSLRYKYFDETSKERKLQRVREHPKGENKDALYAGFYFYDNNKEVILENLVNANIITAGDGEVGDLADFPEITNPSVKLKTAIGTKGLEYDAVMIFKFSSDPAFKSFQKIVKDESFSNESEKYEIAHFFTKLYIAISRARYQLFIVDTEESYETFWKYFTDYDLWEKLMSRFATDDTKRQLIGHLTFGDISKLHQRLSESYDPESNGWQEFEKAKGASSISGMKIAQSYFLEAGLTALADMCEAFIFLYGHEYKKSGDKFISLKREDMEDMAISAYWKGECWSDIITMISKNSNLTLFDTIRLIASKFMNNSISPQEFLQQLVINIDAFQDTIASHKEDMILWVRIFNELNEKLSVIDNVNISISLIHNLDLISKYTKWYKNGFAELRAKLYFNIDEYRNMGIGEDNLAFRTDGYKNAIKLWEEINQTENNKNYFKAKKLTSKTDSDVIIWMDVLKEHDDIINRFGDKSIASSLTDEAASIVFTCLLNKDYSKAIAYPFPKDSKIKWNRLYTQNRTRFLTDVVLTDFSPEKFYFLADKIKNEEKNIFDDRLPTGVFEDIFSLSEMDRQGRPYWTYFTSMLKDEHGNRILKQETNRIAILESLNIFINNDKSYCKELASCFLEMLFDKSYNSARADKFKQTVVSIFARDLFFKEDFRKVTQRNKYFTQLTNLDNEEHDTIKINICRYAEHYLAGVRKINSSTTESIKALMRAYEICIAYQGIYPDFKGICTMYKKYMKIRKYDEMNEWMQQRLLFNNYLDNGVLQKSSFNDFKQSLNEKSLNLIKVADDFSKEDAARFIATSGIQEKDYSYDRMFVTAKLVYKHNLRRDNLKPYCMVNDLLSKLGTDVDKAIKEVLSNKQRIDEYAIKILTYVWEAFFENRFVAKHYDLLVHNSRLTRLGVLTDYLKKRALLHYSHINSNLFKEKQKEFGISMSIDYLPTAHPYIEEKNILNVKTSSKKTDETTKETKTKKSARETNKAKETETKSSNKKGESSTTKNIDPAKIQLFDVARTLKNMGQSIDFIFQAVSQKLTIDEIASLWEKENN